LGKYGTFSSNLLLSRPYNLTYELLDRAPGEKDSDLRIVPASELHADTIAEEEGTGSKDTTIGGDGVEFQLVGENGEVVMRSNRETIDDSARQTLTMEEIEELKREGTGAGKDLIAKLMLSHTGLEQKTSFSLAKYKLLKTKKYLRRFTVLPVDVPLLTQWMMEEKDSGKILEMREEMLALIGSWSNVHYASSPDGLPEEIGGRWLVVDETGGLLVAAMAERMGLLHANPDNQDPDISAEAELEMSAPPSQSVDPNFATSNTITMIHANAQPNLNLLSYFNYEPNAPTSTSSKNHPLSTHLIPLSWLQLISPSADSAYTAQPRECTPAEISAMKSAKRGAYYRKIRRYTRARYIVDSTRAGGFDGLAIASSMDPVSVLRHTIPLLRGGASIAVFSPSVEPLAVLSDLYSTSRRTAFLQRRPKELDGLSQEEMARWQGNEDFPLNPTLILGSSLQTARVRAWQVLPGRTHPVMTSRGGSEGYLWTAVRVIPAEGKIEARGKYVRKKTDTAAKEEKGAVEQDQLEPEGKTQSPGTGDDTEMKEL
jgi:tRNA (adenine-N(1)-)-methyltransferase non-catalytic subunit